MLEQLLGVIEKQTSYPEDDFGPGYDKVVDRAELNALADMIRETAL